MILLEMLCIPINSIDNFVRIDGMQNLTYELTRDLDFAGYENYKPLKMQGEFNGGGHWIRNLLVTQTNKYGTSGSKAAYETSGVFEAVHQYTILRNTNFENVTVSVEVMTSKTYAGVVFGFGSPNVFNVEVRNSAVFTRGLSSRFTGTIIGYIPILTNWCNFTGVVLRNITVFNTTNYFRQLGQSQQHTYGGLVGYTNQHIRVYDSKVVSNVAQNQINQYTVIGGAVGKIGYYASVTLSNITVYTQFNTQLLKNGTFGSFVGENEYARTLNIENCFVGVFGQSYTIPIHIIGYNYTTSKLNQVVIQYELDTNNTVEPVGLNAANPSVYVYSNITVDTTPFTNMVVIPHEQRSQKPFYTKLKFEADEQGAYFRMEPLHWNKLPYLDDPSACAGEHQFYDNQNQVCLCDDFYVMNAENACILECPVNDVGASCSGLGECLLDPNIGPYCQCTDTNCILSNCGCPKCPYGCVCGLNNVCDSCLTGYDDVAQDCSICASGYFMNPTTSICAPIVIENCTTCNGVCTITKTTNETITCTSCNEGWDGTDCTTQKNKSGFDLWWIILVILLLLLLIIGTVVGVVEKKKCDKKRNALKAKSKLSNNTLETTNAGQSKNGASSPESQVKNQNQDRNKSASKLQELKQQPADTAPVEKLAVPGDVAPTQPPRKRIKISKNLSAKPLDLLGKQLGNAENTSSKQLNLNLPRKSPVLPAGSTQTKKLNLPNKSSANDLFAAKKLDLGDISGDKDKLNAENAKTRKINDDGSKYQHQKKTADQIDELFAGLHGNTQTKQIASPLQQDNKNGSNQDNSDQASKNKQNKCGLDLDFSNKTDQTIKKEDIANDMDKYKYGGLFTGTNPLNVNDNMLNKIQNPASTVILDQPNPSMGDQNGEKKKRRKKKVVQGEFELEDDFNELARYSDEYLQARSNQLNNGKVVKLDKNLKPASIKKVKLMPIKKRGNVDVPEEKIFI